MKKGNYIDNKHFEELIQIYMEEPDLAEEELMAMFDLLIKNIINSFNFKVDLDDAKQDCFLLILKTLKNYRRSEGSAFNYFTTIIVNNLKLIYTKNKKYKENIKSYSEIIARRDLNL
tara:strand:- start:484 stop:834 length:351 start_codon:yes stop_codon:yes gene_type:complete